MGLFDDAISDRDAEAFVDDDVFAEEITYTPRGAAAVTFNAVVDRDPPAIRDGTGNVRKPRMVVTFRNHATEGRTSIDVGGDTITVAYRKGGSAEAFQVKGPIRQDAGMWVVELG